jgi:hypothetical protein
LSGFTQIKQKTENHFFENPRKSTQSASSAFYSES